MTDAPSPTIEVTVDMTGNFSLSFDPAILRAQTKLVCPPPAQSDADLILGRYEDLGTALVDRKRRPFTRKTHPVFIADDQTRTVEVDGQVIKLSPLRRIVHQGGVYFLQGELSSLIKIGVSGHVENRVSTHRSNNAEPLHLRLIIPGDIRTEGLLHLWFAADRRHGEWFRPSPALLDFIAQQRRLFDLPEWAL